MKKIFSFILFVATLFVLTSSYKKINYSKPQTGGISRWTGTLSLDETFTGMMGTSEKHVRVSFTDALPTMYRDVETTDLTFTDDKGTGSVTSHSENTIGPKCVTDCSGGGKSELHAVVINESDSTYDIEAIGPACNGTNCDGTPFGPEFTDILVHLRPLGASKDLLAGTKTETVETPGIGTITTSITWHLVRSKPVDVELIVTPVNYDNWLPAPGRDELTKGSVMTVNLKLQGKNGKPLTVKAESFELRLSNTSKEPGITINYPVSPRAKQLPDLRFLLLPGIESIDEDQFTTISCMDGSTGKALIASYDGGGWATLTVEATLKDERHIKGQLLVSGGEEDILIPKRIPGTKIALAWSKANGNPGDMDDKETSNGNKNNGDGLTAYEEYRGVISQGQFKRLKPDKKELGLLVKRSEKNIFQDGFAAFSKASDIECVLFDKNEIPDNRRINQNASTAHSFNQYALRLSKGNTGEQDIYGITMTAWGLTYPTNDIPARVTHIVIDVDGIHSWYQQAVQAWGAANLPFTEKDLVASTTAHEIGHGVSLDHHGQAIPPRPGFDAVSNPPRVFSANARGNWENTDRPLRIEGPIGLPGNNESGNVSCFMCYRSKSNWVRIAANTFDFYQVPLMPAGTIFCTDKKGTGINANKQYFGDAINGECLSHIKLRD